MFRFNKKIVLIILMLFSILLLAGCENKNEEVKETLKIGITMYDEFDPFTNKIVRRDHLHLKSST